jgi:hypothetical protein
VDPVIVRVPGLDRPCPREVQPLDARLDDPSQLGVGHVGSHVAGVFLDQTHQLLPLRGGQVGGGDAGRRGESLAPAGTGDDVAQRLRGDDQSRALGGVQTLGERARQVCLARERAKAGQRARAHLGRVGPEEDRGDGDRLARHQREVQRQVVTLEAPAPGRA